MARYTNDEVQKITKIKLDMLDGKIPYKVSEKQILEVNQEFPVHNLKGYNKNSEKYLSGIGCYGPRYLPLN